MTPWQHLVGVLAAVALTGCSGGPSAEPPGHPAKVPTAEELGLVPQPAHVTTRAGAFTLSASTRIAVSPGAEGVGDRLAEVLRRSTGFALPVVTGVTGSKATGDVAL